MASPVVAASPAAAALSIVVADVGVSFGGAIVSGATLCGGLTELGHRTTLVTALGTEEVRHVVPPSVDLRTLQQGVDYRRWDEMQRQRAARPAWLRRLTEYPDVARHLILQNLPYAWRLAAICREVGATLLHANNGPDLATAMAARLARRPLVMHLRGVHSASRIVDLAVGTAERCIAISQHTAAGCIAAGVPPEKTRVLLNPVEPRWPDPARVLDVRQELGATPSDFLIGSVGRIVEWKGQLELLRALTPLLQETPDMRLAIVGDEADGRTGYLAALHAWVIEHGLDKQVRFAGFRRDIESVYAALDVMAHSAISPEPFGRVIVEAMLYGCAVIASPMGGPLEIITDGVDGMLLDPRRPEALREGVRRLHRDQAFRQRVAEAGAVMVRGRFGARSYAERLVALYADLLMTTSTSKR